MKYIRVIICIIALSAIVGCKKEAKVEPKKDGTEATTDTEVAKPVAKEEKAVEKGE